MKIFLSLIIFKIFCLSLYNKLFIINLKSIFLFNNIEKFNNIICKIDIKMNRGFRGGRGGPRGGFNRGGGGFNRGGRGGGGF